MPTKMSLLCNEQVFFVFLFSSPQLRATADPGITWGLYVRFGASVAVVIVFSRKRL
jgi:hypothetical protein